MRNPAEVLDVRIRAIVAYLLLCSFESMVIIKAALVAWRVKFSVMGFTRVFLLVGKS